MPLPAARCSSSRCRSEIGGVDETLRRESDGARHPPAHEEVKAVEIQMWETPQFEEIGVAPEVTMYVAQMDD